MDDNEIVFRKWPDHQQFMKASGVRDHIDLFEGRPDRVKPIGNEDIVNLKIAINTASSLEEFISLV